MKKKLNIIYEDKHLLVVSKPAKLLCVSTPKEKERTLYHEVYTYLKQKNKQNKVFVFFMPSYAVFFDFFGK